MRKFLTLIAGAAVLAAPAFAQARGFDADFTQKITGPFKLEVIASDDLAYRADHLPKKLSERDSTSPSGSSFANNGEYGDREIEYLVKELKKELVRDFDKRELVLSDSAPTLLRVTIEDARPNRPTFRQATRDVDLSFQSVSIGGADVSAEIITPGGQTIGTAEYSYTSNFGDGQTLGSGTWTDALVTFERFSKDLSKKLEKMATPDS